MISGINTWVLGVVRYGAGIMDWTMEEVANVDRRIGHLHDGIILLPRPECFVKMLSYSNLYPERRKRQLLENKSDNRGDQQHSGLGSKMMPPCKFAC